MPPVWPHGRCTKRRWCHSHLSPTDTLYPAGRYGSGLVELNSALTPRSARWCVRKSYRQVDPLGFRPGRAHILQAQVKPQHLGSENHQSWDTLRSAPLSPIPDRLFRAHPHQSTQNAFSCRFYLTHTHQEPIFPTQHMHHEAQHIYTLINIYSSRTIKNRIFKVGSARFISMHIK
jgi:hypothetical protein